MKKFYILLEDDWELKGNGYGNVAELQYLPSLSLMNICEKLNIKMTFMVDVAQQLKFIEHMDSPEVKVQKELWDNTVQLMKRKGFDVQLHLHPQWIHAKYDNKNFYVTADWNIGVYNDTERETLVNNSVKYLNELLKPIDSNYKVNSFKPGSWGLQPSNGILNNLSNAGIKLILGIKKDLVVPNLKIDYRNLEEDTLPYYPVFENITKVSKDKNSIIALPLLPYSPNLITLGKLFIYTLIKKIAGKFFDKDYEKKQIPKSIRNLKPLGKVKFKKSFRPYLTHLKIGDQPFGYLKDSFDEVIKRLEQIDAENIPIVIEAHTKDFIDNFSNIEKFLNYIMKEYGNKVEFIDLTTFLCKIENNEFTIRYKND